MPRKLKPAGAALITGAAKRIGHQLALHLAKQGYDIALHYHHSLADAEKTARQINKQGVHCQLFHVDLNQEKATGDLIPQVLEVFPNLHLLINNAAVFSPSRLTATSLDGFRRHFKTNFLAPYQLIKGFIHHCPRGQIINIIDTHYNRNMLTHADYILSKKLLAELTKMAALECGPHIRVNGIAPGLILPPKGKGVVYLEKRAKKIPLGKKGSPDHLVHALQFLLENDFVTGQIIFVDGGEHLLY